jgi:hypothetical protein
MKGPLRYRLTDDEKDALLREQAALIDRLVARITELEALVGKPRKTPSNSHIPPSQEGPGRKNRDRCRSGGRDAPRIPTLSVRRRRRRIRRNAGWRMPARIAERRRRRRPRRVAIVMSTSTFLELPPLNRTSGGLGHGSDILPWGAVSEPAVGMGLVVVSHPALDGGNGGHRVGDRVHAGVALQLR